MQGRDGLRLETELRLGLPGGGGGCGGSLVEKNEKKRVFCDISGELIRQSKAVKKNDDQVVGWPPVCSYRRRNSFKRDDERKTYLKVSMDGAPFLRKIDLSTQKNYSNLVLALERLFDCFGIGEAMEDHSDYLLIYEDKDGDWMLVGDVPWEMFSESCKRLRIKKRSDANGIGLHAKDLLKEISKGD